MSTGPFKRRRFKAASKCRTRTNDSSGSSDADVKRAKPQKQRVCSSLVTKLSQTTENVFQQFESSGTNLSGPLDQGATLYNEAETLFDRDEQAIQERARKINKEEETDDNVYRGLNYYKKFIEKKDSPAGSATSGLGPIRAPMNIRVTTRWDYQPDICKDYKETGFCGFGDNCKFLHDRSDYKFGWQLEQEERAGRQESDDKYIINSSDSSDDEVIPAKCPICRQSFNNPVVTKCFHYFCEKCALDQFRQRGSKCFSCGKDTEGRFAIAHRLVDNKEEQKSTMNSTAVLESQTNTNNASDLINHNDNGCQLLPLITSIEPCTIAEDCQSSLVAEPNENKNMSGEITLISQFVKLSRFNIETENFDGQCTMCFKVKKLGGTKLKFVCDQGVEITSLKIDNIRYIDILKVENLNLPTHCLKTSRKNINILKQYLNFGKIIKMTSRGNVTIYVPPCDPSISYRHIEFGFSSNKIHICPNKMFAYSKPEWLPYLYEETCLWLLEIDLPKEFNKFIATGERITSCRFESKYRIHGSDLIFVMGQFVKYTDYDFVEAYTLPNLSQDLKCTMKFMKNAWDTFHNIFHFKFPLQFISFVFLPCVQGTDLEFVKLGLCLLDSCFLLNWTLVEPWWQCKYLLVKALAKQIFGCLYFPGSIHDRWIVEGFRDWLMAEWVKQSLGNSQYRYLVYSLSQKCVQYGYPIRHRSCGVDGCCLVKNSFPKHLPNLFAERSFLTVRSIELFCGRDTFIEAAQKMIDNANLSNGELFESNFWQQLNPRENISDTDFLYSFSGLYEFRLKYSFNKRKNVVEVEIEQQSIGRPKQPTNDFLYLNDSLCSSRGFCISNADIFRGYVQISVQTLDDYFVHMVHIDESRVKLELPCPARQTKRSKKRLVRLQSGEEIDFKDGCECDVLFIRFDPDYRLGQRRVWYDQSSHFINQLVFSREVLGQLEAIDILGSQDQLSSNDALREALEFIIKNDHVFFYVQMAACELMGQVTHDSGELFDLLVKNFYDNNIKLMYVNNIPSINKYMVRLALIHSIGRSKNHNLSTINSLLAKLLKSITCFDRKNTVYYEAYYICALLESATRICVDLGISNYTLFSTLVDLTNWETIIYNALICDCCLKCLFMMYQGKLIQLNDQLAFLNVYGQHLQCRQRLSGLRMLLKIISLNDPKMRIYSFQSLLDLCCTDRHMLISLFERLLLFEKDHYLIANSNTSSCLWEFLTSTDDALNRDEQIMELAFMFYKKFYDNQKPINSHSKLYEYALNEISKL